ncbi:mCG1051046 [Mus musculus]|nr:mCG1051046 [Mus musculus]
MKMMGNKFFQKIWSICCCPPWLESRIQPLCWLPAAQTEWGELRTEPCFGMNTSAFSC